MKRNIKAILMVVLVIVAVITNISYMLDNQAKEYEEKLEIQNKESIKVIDDLVKLTHKQSDIEILGFAANIAATDAKSRLEHIEELKLEIKTQQEIYEFQLLTQRCFEAQIYRMTNNLEYNLEYCKEEVNLEQFRTKKY